jgi:hypothetical protein
MVLLVWIDEQFCSWLRLQRLLHAISLRVSFVPAPMHGNTTMFISNFFIISFLL